MAQTTYEIALAYKLQADKVATDIGNITKATDQAARSSEGLTKGLLGIGAAWVAGKGLGLASEMLIGMNSQFEQMKISMAGIASYNLGIGFDEASKSTDKLLEKWQAFSKTTTLTTAELVRFGSAITTGVLSSGGGIGVGGVLDQITRRGAVVGKAVASGHPGGSGYVALELNEALMGNVNKRQLFNKSLLTKPLNDMGLELEDFNKQTQEKRTQIILAALNDPAWDNVIKRSGESFEGVTSTFKDSMEILGRDVGAPLFKTITQEIRSWNEWLKKNEETVNSMAKTMGNGLVDAFHAIKDSASFLVEHKDALMAVAGAFAIYKGIQGVSAISAGITAAGGAAGIGGAALWTSAAAISFITSPAVIAAVVSAVAVYGVSKILAAGNASIQDTQNHLNKVDQGRASTGHGDSMMRHAQVWAGIRGTTASATSIGEQAGVFAGGSYNRDAANKFALQYSTNNSQIAEIMTAFDAAAKTLPDRAKAYADTVSYLTDVTKPAADAIKGLWEHLMGSDYDNAEGEAMFMKEADKKPKLNVNVQIKNEIHTNDPDRFAVDSSQALEKILTGPTMSRYAARGGF